MQMLLVIKILLDKILGYHRQTMGQHYNMYDDGIVSEMGNLAQK